MGKRSFKNTVTVVALMSTMSLVGCQKLVDLTVGAYLECDKVYPESTKNQACYAGVGYAVEGTALMDLSSDKQTIVQKVQKAASIAKGKCENIYGMFDGRRGACKDGVNYYRNRAENALR